MIMAMKTSIESSKTKVSSILSSYRRYAEIKAKIKELEEEAMSIAPNLISDLKNGNGGLRTLWGHFSLRKNKTIIYPAVVEKRISSLKMEIKNEQERSISTGKCRVNETTSLVLSMYN